MSKKRPSISSEIKREVRKRCGFGCVICGIPLYDYDHIEEWSVVKEHTVDNITLLCSKHHREKTNGLLSKEQVIAKNSNPYNLDQTVSSKYDLHFEGFNFELELGKINMKLEDVNPNDDYIIPFLIDNKKVISFDIIEGRLFFNLVVLDEANNVLLKIIENQLVYSTGNWDVEFVGRNLKVREGKRNIIIDIDFLIPNKVRINKGVFKFNNKEIVVTESNIKIGNFTYSGQTIKNVRVGIALGEYDESMPCLMRLR